jgi:hypothetical protein
MIELKDLKVLYFDELALTEPSFKLYRIDGGDHRYYYRTDGELKFYPSITTVLSATLPKPEHLVRWIAENGYDESAKIRDEKAEYGTKLHGLIAQYLIDGEIDIDMVMSVHEDTNLASDLLSFAQFAKDYNVRPLAVEIGVIDDELGIAGFLDLVCRMDIVTEGYFGEKYKTGKNKGNPKLSKVTTEIVAIVDFKSGRKGFYEAHEIQVNWYLKAWNLSGMGLEATHCFNWSPKDWRDVPTYTLKDQTGAKSYAKLPHLSACFHIDNNRPSAVKSYSGTLNKDTILDCYAVKSIETLIEEKHEKRQNQTG